MGIGDWLGFGGKAPTVLIIDDSALIQEVVRQLLTPLGYEVIAAKSGQEGIELAKTKKPGLILLDIQMPGLSGTATCRLLKADAKTAGIPILMCSTVQLMNEVEKTFSYGAVGYVIKPVDHDKLIKKVEEVFPITRK